MFDLIKEDFLVVYQKDPAIKSKIELFFNYPGVWAIFWYRIANKLYKNNFKILARSIMGITQIFTNIDIHPAATIGRRVFIDHGVGVVIGQTAIVGDDVTIYQGVTLGGVSLHATKRHPTIENNVTIGAGAKILGNITIGAKSKIGANSVVVKDVPPHSTVVGIPGKIIHRKDNEPLSHNKLPDIDKELFVYLFERIKTLEDALKQHDIDIQTNQELRQKYAEYINSIKK
ncbi:MAG: serine O-acetyltransferase [Epsilonproteobacteria bacterium]|nr:serine O-acetyltransferase [Campylobacterota bacterium]